MPNPCLTRMCSSDDQDAPGRQRRGSGGGRAGGHCAKKVAGPNGRSEEELLLLDPKRVKRILANRQSAARSKLKQKVMAETLRVQQQLAAKRAAQAEAELGTLKRKVGPYNP